MSDARRRPRCFLVGYYGAENLGDEEIRRSVEREARDLGVDIFAYATRDRASTDPRARRLRSVRFGSYLLACARADRVVLGGGGILKDEGIGLPLELLLTAAVARVFRRPVSLLAVGVGPFYSRFGRWVVGAIARLAEIRTVRDEASARALERLGVSGVEIGADPIFADAWGATPALAPDRSAQGHEAIVSVRPWFHRTSGGARRWAELRGSLAACLDQLAGAGYRIRAVALYWPRDRQAADEVVGRMLHPEVVTIDSAPVDWPGLMDAVAGARLVLAMRYHAVAASAIAGTPTIAVAYEPKVTALVEDVGILGVELGAPGIGDRLRSAIAAVVESPDSSRPDPAAVAALGRRSRRALSLALLGRTAADSLDVS